MQVIRAILASGHLFPVWEFIQIRPIRIHQNRLGLRNFFSLGLAAPGKSFIDIYSLGCIFKTVQLVDDFNQTLAIADHRPRDGKQNGSDPSPRAAGISTPPAMHVFLCGRALRTARCGPDAHCSRFDNVQYAVDGALSAHDRIDVWREVAGYSK